MLAYHAVDKAPDARDRFMDSTNACDTFRDDAQQAQCDPVPKGLGQQVAQDLTLARTGVPSRGTCMPGEDSTDFQGSSSSPHSTGHMLLQDQQWQVQCPKS